MGKKKVIAKAVKFAISGFSLLFIGILVFITIHDLMTGESSTTAEYCKKYGFLASPDCW